MGDYHRLPADWRREVRAADLPDIYQEVAAVIGVEATLKLAETFGGASPYFPVLGCALRDIRNRAIRREFTGANHKELARRWGLSVRHLRQIVNPSREGQS